MAGDRNKKNNCTEELQSELDTALPNRKAAVEQSPDATQSESGKEELDRCLTLLMEQQRYMELREQCTFEWQQISVIFDRFFLVSFITINIFVSLFMLVINPMTRNFDSDTLLSSVVERDQQALVANNEAAARAQVVS